MTLLLERLYLGERPLRFSVKLADDVQTLVRRADELLSQFETADGALAAMPDPDEVGATIARTLALPEIAQLRHGLVAELSVFSTLSDVDTLSLTGRAYALYMEDDHPRIVVDWKSDVKPTDREVEVQAAQLRVYMRATRAERGALVYFSSGHVHWLVPPTSESVFQGVIEIPPTPK